MQQKSVIQKCRNFLTSVKDNPKFKGGMYGASLLLTLLGIADVMGILLIVPFQGLFCFAACIWLLCCLLHRMEAHKNKTVFRHLRNAVLFAAAIELVVFQWHSFHLMGGSYPETELDLTQASVVNFDPVSGNNQGQGEIWLTFENVNMPVGTIRFELEADNSSFKDVWVDITDDTYSAQYRNSIAVARIISGNERSRSIVCNFSGNVHSIRFRYSAAEGETVTLRSVTLNQPINIYISIVRLLFLFGMYFCVAMLTRSEWAKRSITDNKRSVRACAGVLTAALMVTALFLVNLGRYSSSENTIADDFRSQSGNQITQEIVDAFEEGHTYISIVSPDDPLLALENPYDRSQRDDVYAHWDHLLFDGKIYSYYGIAPVLVLFLPYHALTGYYFPTQWAVWLFGCIGILFLTKLYLYLMYQFFPRMHTAPVLCGLGMMQMISGAWFCFFKPLFYEIAQMSGFASIMAGAYFLIRANVIGEGKLSLWRLAVSATCLSLGVLSRPTLAVYCMAAMLFLWMGLKKQLSQSKAKRDVTKYVLCALLPYVILGGVQMVYNYVRFGSVMDFGIQYSLTINDFTNSQYHSHFVLIGLYNYLIAVPDFKPEFPFFDCTPVETFFPQGYYFVATYSAIGILWKALPVAAYAKAGKAYRLSENSNKRMYLLMIAAVCAAAPFAVMFSIWESGYGARYCVDFAWQILIGALIIAFIIYQKCSADVKRHLTALMTGSTVLCFLLTFGQTYTWIINALSIELQSKAFSFARLFEVWR